MANARLKASGIVELLRVHNLAIAALTTYIGYGAVAAANGCSLFDGYYTLSIIFTVVLVAAGGYVINDYYDVGTDSIVKPWRPIPSGRVSPREAYMLAAALVVSGVVLAFAVATPLIGVYALVNAVLVWEYSRWIKRTGFTGNIVVALNSSATILMGALAKSAYEHSSIPVVSLVPAFVAFILVLGREIVKGIEDYIGDREECYFTLAVVAGPRRAAAAAAAILLAVVAVSPLPLLGGYTSLYLPFALAVDAITLYVVAMLLRAESTEALIKTSAKARSLLKIAFLLGAAAFIMGLPVG